MDFILLDKMVEAIHERIEEKKKTGEHYDFQEIKRDVIHIHLGDFHPNRQPYSSQLSKIFAKAANKAKKTKKILAPLHTCFSDKQRQEMFEDSCSRQLQEMLRLGMLERTPDGDLISLI